MGLGAGRTDLEERFDVSNEGFYLSIGVVLAFLNRFVEEVTIYGKYMWILIIN